MLPGDRLRKTEKGRLALASRNGQLPGPLRTLLLLIYGEKTAVEYSEIAAKLPAGRTGLMQLIAMEFVEVVSSSTIAPPVQAPAPAPEPEPEPIVPPSVITANGHASTADEKTLYHLLYPEFVKTVAGLGLRGVFLQMKVERAMSAHELFSLCGDVETALNNAKGQAAGAEFVKRINFMLSQT